MRVVAVLALLIVTAAVASVVAKVDIVAPTRGEIVARERTRDVRALVTGVVSALRVDEGSRVEAGAMLVEIDDTIVASEIRRIEAELTESRRTVRRLRLRSGIAPSGNGESRVSATPSASRAPVARGWQLHLRLAELERARLAAALAEAEGRVEAGRRRRAEVVAERRLVDRLLPVVREQVDGLAVLAARSHASRHDYLRELSRRIEFEGRAQSLAIADRREEGEIARQQASARLLRLEHDAAREGQLMEAELGIVRLAEELVQARRRLAHHRITAPVDGVVQNVGGLADGSFVRQGDRLMAVVPVGGGVEIRVYVRNRDVGFVMAGQEAIVKIDAFPFTRYGTAEGVVEGISLDAVRDAGESGAPEDVPAEYSAGYLARIALARPALEIDGTVVPLRPGMQVVVDIRTGRRRLIDYVLAPLVAYGSGAFRER